MSKTFVFKGFRDELAALAKRYAPAIPAGGRIEMVAGTIDRDGFDIDLRFVNDQNIAGEVATVSGSR